MAGLLSKIFSRGTQTQLVDGSSAIPNSMRLLAHQTSVISTMASRQGESMAGLLNELRFAARAVTCKALDRFASSDDLSTSADIGIKLLSDGVRTHFSSSPDQVILTAGGLSTASCLAGGLGCLSSITQPPNQNVGQAASQLTGGPRWGQTISFVSPSDAHIITVTTTTEKSGPVSQPVPVLRVSASNRNGSDCKEIYSLQLEAPILDLSLSKNKTRLAILEDDDGEGPKLKVLNITEDLDGVEVAMLGEPMPMDETERIAFTTDPTEIIGLSPTSLSLIRIGTKSTVLKLSGDIPKHVGDRDAATKIFVSDLGDRIVSVLPVDRPEGDRVLLIAHDILRRPDGLPQLLCASQKIIANSFNSVRWMTLSPSGSQIAVVGSTHFLRVIDIDHSDTSNDGYLKLPFRGASKNPIKRDDITISFLDGGSTLGIGLSRYDNPDDSTAQNGALMIVNGAEE